MELLSIMSTFILYLIVIPEFFTVLGIELRTSHILKQVLHTAIFTGPKKYILVEIAYLIIMCRTLAVCYCQKET